MNYDSNVELNPEDAQRLADALVRRRIEIGYRSARSLSQEIGLDPRTITGLENARKDVVSRNVLTTLEVGLKWPPGYIQELLDSGRGSRDFAGEQRVYITTTTASEQEIRIARSVAQAAFESTLASLRNTSVTQ